MRGRTLRRCALASLIAMLAASARAAGNSPDVTLRPAPASSAEIAAEIAAAGPVLPRDGLLIAPIPGLTTAWHPAPSRAEVPAGSRVRFLRAVHPRVTVVWRGAAEIYRDGRWSMAEARLDGPGERLVEVDYVLPNGQALTDRIALDAVRQRAETFRVTGVRVEPAAAEKAGGAGAAVTAEGAGRFRAAHGARLRLVAAAEPAGFAPLVEWRLDGGVQLEVGPEIGLVATRAGEREVAAGPPGREAGVRIETPKATFIPPAPMPKTVQEAFTSTANVTVTLDPADNTCAGGIRLALTSTGLDPAVVQLAGPPYQSGQVISTQMTALELGAFSTDVGNVLVRQRTDRQSLGRIEDVVAAPDGRFVSGRSSFDVFVAVELPDLGLSFTTGDQPVHLQAAAIKALPPLGSPYAPVDPEPVPLVDPETGKQSGWLCHADHTPVSSVPPGLGTGTGGGTPPDEDCFSSTGQTTLSLSTAAFAAAFQGLAGKAAVEPGETMLVDLALSSEGLAPASVLLDPGPYEPGQVIATEMARLQLQGSAPGVGRVVLSERQDRHSRGQVVVEAVDADGNLVAGHASFDLFLEVALPDIGMTLHTGMEPIHVETGTMSGLPPVGTPYQHDPDDDKVPLYNASTFQQAGEVVTGHHWVTQPKPCPCSADLDIDSDNNNGVNLPDRSAAEDAIEEAPPGKYIGLNDDDDDGNKIRDLAEEPIRPNPPEDDPVWMVLEVKPNKPPDKWTLTYTPQVQVYDMDVAPVQIMPSGVTKPAPLTPNPKNVKVEGVQPSAALGDVVMTLTYQCITTDQYGYAHTETVSDKVVATVIKVDLDVDSDNTNGTAPFGPQRDQAEDDIEDDVARPGRYVQVNDDDDDQDGVVDFSDGFNLAAGAADDVNAQENDFVRMVLEVPAPIDLNVATLRFTYSASDPAGPAAGRLRIWKKNGNQARNKAHANAGGDYVHTGDVYSAANLGLAGATRTVDLWIEGIAPSLAQSDRILVEVDPDGAGPAQFVARDAVRVTAVQLAFLDDANAVVAGAGQNARLMVSNMITDRLTDAAAAGSFPQAAVNFNGPPTGDPDVFRAELRGAPAGLAPQFTVDVMGPNNAVRNTANYGAVAGNVGGANAYRTDRQLRLVTHTADDGVGATSTRLTRIDDVFNGNFANDGVRARVTLGATTYEARLPVCRPPAEAQDTAIRTAQLNFVNLVGVTHNTGTTIGWMGQDWAQVCVRFSAAATTNNQATVSNVLLVQGAATGAGAVTVTINTNAFNVPVANGNTAQQIATAVAAAINGTGGLTAAAFRHNADWLVVVNRGTTTQPTFNAAPASTAPGVTFTQPTLTYADANVTLLEGAALGINYRDNNAQTIDYFTVSAGAILTTAAAAAGFDQFTTTLPGWDNAVMSTQADMPPNLANNRHVASHETGHVLFDGNQPDNPVAGDPSHSTVQTNLIWDQVLIGEPNVNASKRLTNAQNTDARNDSGPGSAGPAVLLQQN